MQDDSERWVKLHQKLLKSVIWQNCPLATRVCWITCLIEANWTDRVWYDGRVEHLISRGSFITSRAKLAKTSGISQKQVRTALEHMKNLKMVQVEGQAFTKITITNYEHYQQVPELEGQQEGQARAKRGPSEGHNLRSTRKGRSTRTGEEIYCP